MNRNIAFVLILFGLVVTTIEYSAFSRSRKSLICFREFFDDGRCSYECVTAGRGKGRCIWNDEKNSPRGSCVCELDHPNYINLQHNPPDLHPGGSPPYFPPPPPIYDFLICIAAFPRTYRCLGGNLGEEECEQYCRRNDYDTGFCMRDHLTNDWFCKCITYILNKERFDSKHQRLKESDDEDENEDDDLIVF
uniref:Salivary secreted protein n=1 Tax=Parastrongyloides trichosuri TaxID=131310 RepID=A0A0N4ZKX2_PARTI